MICWVKEKQMEGSFGWGWVVDLKFVFHLLKPINTAMKYFLLKVEISNPGVLKVVTLEDEIGNGPLTFVLKKLWDG